MVDCRRWSALYLLGKILFYKDAFKIEVTPIFHFLSTPEKNNVKLAVLQREAIACLPHAKLDASSVIELW